MVDARQITANSAAASLAAADRIGPFRSRRAVVAAILITLALLPTELGDLTRSLMTDAFTQVSVFVAATLLLFYGAERLFHFDIGESLKGARAFQVPWPPSWVPPPVAAVLSSLWRPIRLAMSALGPSLQR